MHYAGVACDMDKIMEIARKYKLFVVEDAAQAIDSLLQREDRWAASGTWVAFLFMKRKISNAAKVECY